jgi:hypothetical protein
LSATIFQIEDGKLALALVDTAAVGYADSWQAPAGHTLATVDLTTDFTGTTAWSCQVTSAALEASANTNDVTVPATFCQASTIVPQPGVTSYSLNGEFLQDVNVDDGLSRFLFENDTEEAYFYLGLDGEVPPFAIGRVRLIAGSFGGPARENLTSTLALPLSRKPDVAFGVTGSAVGVEGDGTLLDPLTLSMAAAAQSEPEPEPVGV